MQYTKQAGHQKFIAWATADFREIKRLPERIGMEELSNPSWHFAQIRRR